MSSTPESRKKHRDYMREYSKRPEVKARKRARENTPERKAIRRARANTPEHKERRRVYTNSPKGKAVRLEYISKPEVRIKILAYQRKWQRAYALTPPGKVTRRKYRMTNIKDYENRLASNRRRRARKKGAHGTHTTQEWFELRGITGGYCPACGKNINEENLTSDHITPLSKQGTNYIENIQPLCLSCNSAKWNKHSTNYLDAFFDAPTTFIKVYA